MMTGPLQVVPEDSEDTDEAVPSAPPAGLSEFELKLQEANAESDIAAKSGKVVMPRRRHNQPPIRRINQDAKPLTQGEIMAHRHMLLPP